MNRVGVFCRTHVWDDYVASQARKLCELSKGGHFYVLADETRGTLPVEGFYKLSHCDTDFEPMGLETLLQYEPALVQWRLPAL